MLASWRMQFTSKKIQLLSEEFARLLKEEEMLNEWRILLPFVM